MWPEHEIWQSFCIGAVLGLIMVLLLLGHAVFAEEAWVPPKENATEKEEKVIAQGCAYKAEAVFYIAQEKLYAGGDTEKLMAFLERNMTMAEYRVNEKFMRWLGEWVDGQNYKSAHEYARNLFYQCLSNSYQHFNKQPTERAQQYISNFERALDNAEERLLPHSGTEIEA